MRLFDWILSKSLTFIYSIKELTRDSVEPPSPQLVSKRFRQLFIDHGIEETRIPRVFSKITLEDLQSDSLLIKKLTPELINEAAELFKVKSDWLDGVDTTIYHSQTCYKQPKEFFEFLNTIKFGESDFPFRVITPIKKFDYKDDSHQPFSILFVEKIAELGDQDVHRYYIDAGWAWDHKTCRIQLKAMALLYWKHIKHPITIYTVSPDIYFEIENLQKIPYPYLAGSLISNPSVEDYISDFESSVVAKEFEELPEVLRYIEEYKLNNLSIKDLDPEITRYESHVVDPYISLQQKASRARHEPISQLKRECVNFWLANQKLSNSEAARRFYQSLIVERKRLLSESNAEKTLSLAISEFKRRDKLDKLPNWLIGFNPEIS
jgi:hypothetical protein